MKIGGNLKKEKMHISLFDTLALHSGARLLSFKELLHSFRKFTKLRLHLFLVCVPNPEQSLRCPKSLCNMACADPQMMQTIAVTLIVLDQCIHTQNVFTGRFCIVEGRPNLLSFVTLVCPLLQDSTLSQTFTSFHGAGFIVRQPLAIDFCRFYSLTLSADIMRTKLPCSSMVQYLRGASIRPTSLLSEMLYFY